MKLLEEYKNFKIYKTFNYVFNYKYKQLPNKDVYVAENKINYIFIENEDLNQLKMDIDEILLTTNKF